MTFFISYVIIIGGGGGGIYMFATFDQLAKFADEKNSEPQTDSATSAVDLSAIINRLNALEQQQNDILRKIANSADSSTETINGGGSIETMDSNTNGGSNNATN